MGTVEHSGCLRTTQDSRRARQWRACWGTRLKPGQWSVGGRCQLKRQRYHASLGWQASLYCGILNEASLGLVPRQQLSDDSLIKSCKKHLEGGCGVGRLMPPPTNVHILIPGAYKYVTLYGKRDFADVIKLKTLRWGDYLGLPGWI